MSKPRAMAVRVPGPRLAQSALALSLLAFPAAAFAQPAPAGTSCPPGSWFCAQAPQQQAAPAGQPVAPLEALPDADEAPPPAPPPRPRPRHPAAPASEPPPPVVYEPPPVGAVERSETPPPYEYAPPPGHHPMFPHPEWALNLHAQGAAIGHGTAVGGFGGGLRFKPARTFGLEADFDFLGGHDYQGNDRNETAFTLNGLVFVNPRSPVQVYLLLGFGWSGAHVVNLPQSLDANYSYFGGQAGIGLELRMSHMLAFNADFRGFIRGRTDSGAELQPEFTDPAGRSTNTSGGGLFTGGMSLYF
jgi:hypothetical protein